MSDKTSSSPSKNEDLAELAAERDPVPVESEAGQGSPDNSQTQIDPSASDRPESVEEQLVKALLEAEKNKDAWLRTTAELENARKRSQSDISNAHKYALEKFATELLAVKDSLEAALQSDNITAEAIKDGVELTLKQLTKVFDSFEIKEISPLGETLDPHKHQAMNTVESEAEVDTILSVFQKGYLLKDRLIRPAMVSVSKAKE